MKKLTFIAAGMIAILSSSANAFDMHLNQEVGKVRNLVENNLDSKDNWIKDENSGLQEKALAIQTYALYGNNPNLKFAEILMIDVLRANGLSIGPWKERDSKIESNVMANDNLISLQRVMYGKVKFKEIAAKYTIQKDQSEKTREITGNFLSRTLMRNGEAPAGPDGRPVRICRLFNIDNATFYELSEIQSIEFVNNSESNMSLDQACITYKPLVKTYWKNRLKDFIDNQGVEIQ